MDNSVSLALELFTTAIVDNDDDNIIDTNAVTDIDIVNPILEIHQYTAMDNTRFCSDIQQIVLSHIGDKKNILVLDLHNVADIPTFLNKKVKLMYPNWLIVILSFVGRHSKTRLNVTNQFNNLLATNSIDVGILAFERGSKKTANTFNKLGGKAYVINTLASLSTLPSVQIDRLVFIDDSDEHILSSAHVLVTHGAQVKAKKCDTIVLSYGFANIILHTFKFVESHESTQKLEVENINKQNLANLKKVLGIFTR